MSDAPGETYLRKPGTSNTRRRTMFINFNRYCTACLMEGRNTTSRTALAESSRARIGRDEEGIVGLCPSSSTRRLTGLAQLQEPRPGATPARGARQRRWANLFLRRRSGSGSAGSAGGCGGGDANLSALEGPGRAAVVAAAAS